MTGPFHIPPRSFLRQLWRRGRADVCAIAIVLVAAELLLRTFAPQSVGNLYDRETTAGHPIAINRDGYRGPALPEAKTPGVARVLALGDSTTFGTGVAWSETWPHRLGARLAVAGRPRPEVMNVGFPGTSLGSLRREFAQRWIAFSPDAVVVALSANMPALAWIQRDGEPPPVDRTAYAPKPQSALASLRHAGKVVSAALALPSFLRRASQRALYAAGLARHEVDPAAPFGPLLASGPVQADLPPERAREAWALLEAELVSLDADFRRLGIPWTLTYTPTRFMLSPDPADNEKSVPRERLTLDPEAVIARIAAEHALPYVPLRSALLEARRRERAAGRAGELYVPFDFTHLDAVGHEAAAAALAPAVRAILDRSAR